MATCQHHQCQKSALRAAEDVCTQLGARFTHHRRNVFNIVWQSHKAVTAADIMAALGSNQPPITYRALDFLKDVGLIHHIASLNAYVGCLHPHKANHTSQMLICTQCRTVQELSPTSTLSSQLNQQAADVGFQPQQTHLEMLGVCQKCTPITA